jgi:hypothetical protein
MPKQVAPRRSQVRKDRHNKQVEDEVIDDNTFLFGRVIKPLGNCYFEMTRRFCSPRLLPESAVRTAHAFSSMI